MLMCCLISECSYTTRGSCYISSRLFYLYLFIGAFVLQLMSVFTDELMFVLYLWSVFLYLINQCGERLCTESFSQSLSLELILSHYSACSYSYSAPYILSTRLLFFVYILAYFIICMTDFYMCLYGSYLCDGYDVVALFIIFFLQLQTIGFHTYIQSCLV